MTRLLNDSVHSGGPMPAWSQRISRPDPPSPHPLQSCAYCISELVMLQVLTALDFKLSSVIGRDFGRKPGKA